MFKIAFDWIVLPESTAQKICPNPIRQITTLICRANICIIPSPIDISNSNRQNAFSPVAFSATVTAKTRQIVQEQKKPARVDQKIATKMVSSVMSDNMFPRSGQHRSELKMSPHPYLFLCHRPCRVLSFFLSLSLVWWMECVSVCGSSVGTDSRSPGHVSGRADLGSLKVGLEPSLDSLGHFYSPFNMRTRHWIIQPLGDCPNLEMESIKHNPNGTPPRAMNLAWSILRLLEDRWQPKRNFAWR